MHIRDKKPVLFFFMVPLFFLFGSCYDGTPKEIATRTEPPVEPPLVISYFSIPDTAGEPLASPPVERGRYRVSIVFPGNSRYMGASKEITLQIE
jgi:hypothetical protein